MRGASQGNASALGEFFLVSQTVQATPTGGLGGQALASPLPSGGSPFSESPHHNGKKINLFCSQIDLVLISDVTLLSCVNMGI